MGYDLHITRRDDWSAEGNDISKDEFVNYVRRDAEFIFPSALGDDYAEWKSSSTDYTTWLCWSRGSLQTKNPEPEFVDKMVSIAKALRAKAQGDDGEVYLSATETRVDEAAAPPSANSPLEFGKNKTPLLPERLDRLPYFFRWLSLSAAAAILFFLLVLFTTGSKFEPLGIVPIVAWLILKIFFLDPPRLKSIGWSPRLTVLSLLPPVGFFLQIMLFSLSQKNP